MNCGEFIWVLTPLFTAAIVGEAVSLGISAVARALRAHAVCARVHAFMRATPAFFFFHCYKLCLV
eukprot:SAG31_NODE_3058_length_4735_cov_24.146894_5_plen_65_part_00